MLKEGAWGGDGGGGKKAQGATHSRDDGSAVLACVWLRTDQRMS